MKGYYTHSQLRLVGKAWEIRYYLRKLSVDPSISTVMELIDRRRTIRPIQKPQERSLTLIQRQG